MQRREIAITWILGQIVGNVATVQWITPYHWESVSYGLPGSTRHGQNNAQAATWLQSRHWMIAAGWVGGHIAPGGSSVSLSRCATGEVADPIRRRWQDEQHRGKVPASRMSKDKHHHIVADGRQRVVGANADRIARAIRAKYADEMAQAGWFRRLRLRRKIRGEIRRELERIAPPDGLY